MLVNVVVAVNSCWRYFHIFLVYWNKNDTERGNFLAKFIFVKFYNDIMGSRFATIGAALVCVFHVFVI